MALSISLPKRVDDWELRCRYKHADLFSRWLAGEFTTRVGDVGKPSPESDQPPGTVSVELLYSDRRTDDFVARVHFYWLPNGEIGASGVHDPKQLVIDGMVYRQRKGTDPVNRDPSLKFPMNSITRAGYIFYRKRITCSLFGF
jgi:hypothetical protein